MISAKSLSKSWYREIFKHFKTFIFEYVKFLRHGRHSEQGYFSMRQLHYLSFGKMSRLWQAVQRLMNLNNDSLSSFSNIKLSSDETLSHVIRNLDREGFHRFALKLSPDIVKSLYDWSLETPSKPQDVDGLKFDSLFRFEPNRPKSVRYDFEMSTLLKNRDVQKLVCDPLLLNIAENYLGRNPRLDLVSMWWSAPWHGKPNTGAAQFYHADIDRIRFLKFFFFLTDVGSANGPHAYIRNSHRIVRLNGFEDRRYTDEEIYDLYGKDSEVLIKGPAGTIFTADTLGFHKGCVLNQGSRLVFQIQFSNSYFGAFQPSPVEVSNPPPELLEALSRRPEVYTSVIKCR